MVHVGQDVLAMWPCILAHVGLAYDLRGAAVERSSVVLLRPAYMSGGDCRAEWHSWLAE